MSPDGRRGARKALPRRAARSAKQDAHGHLLMSQPLLLQLWHMHSYSESARAFWTHEGSGFAEMHEVHVASAVHASNGSLHAVAAH
jgi:hypothetical protein